MPSQASALFFPVYFKIPHSQISSIFMLQRTLTTTDLQNYVNEEVRNRLHIHARYDIEIVDIDKPGGELAPAIVPNNEQLLIQRYGDINVPIAFYVRPVNPITREYVRNIDYSV